MEIGQDNRSSDVTAEVVEELTENPVASSGRGNEEWLDLESYELGSSERGICRVWIKAEEDGANGHVILSFSDEMGSPKSPVKKMSSWKLKTSTFLAVTSQLVASLLPVSKQGSGRNPQHKVVTLSNTSLLISIIAFLLFMSALWLKPKSSVAARILEMIGCAFTVVGFIGMTTIIFF